MRIMAIYPLGRFKMLFVSIGSIFIGMGILIVYGREELLTSLTLIGAGIGLTIILRYIHQRDLDT